MSNEWNGEENKEEVSQTGFILVEPAENKESTNQVESKESHIKTAEENISINIEQDNLTMRDTNTSQEGAVDNNQPRNEQIQQPNQPSSYQFWQQNANNQNQQTRSESNQTQFTQNEQKIENNSEMDNQNSKNSGKNPPKQKSFVKKLAFAAASAAVFGIVAGACFQGSLYVGELINPTKETIKTEIGTSANEVIERTTTIPSTSITTGGGLDGDVSAVVENAMPSIVSISSTVSQPYSDFFGNTYENEVDGSGSGIIIGKNEKELLIATNNHVVAGAKKIKVTCINNDVLTATIKGSDTSADLAVVAVDLSDIKPETMKEIKVAALGDSDQVKVGEKVLAIGNALGYGQSLTVGYVSAKNREVKVDDNIMVLLQTDAAINPGNSGGALLNIRGEVIGINSVKYAADAVEGMGYAIPISTATPIINELMNKVSVKAGDEGYLGIMGRDVTEEVSTMYNMPMGAFVAEVTEGGGAEKAGILSGDIITAVNGIKTKNMDSVKEKVNGYAAGTEVTVTIERRTGSKYEAQDIKVTLQKQPKVTSSESKEKSKEENNTVTIPFGYDYIPQE